MNININIYIHIYLYLLHSPLSPGETWSPRASAETEFHWDQIPWSLSSGGARASMVALGLGKHQLVGWPFGSTRHAERFLDRSWIKKSLVNVSVQWWLIMVHDTFWWLLSRATLSKKKTIWFIRPNYQSPWKGNATETSYPRYVTKCRRRFSQISFCLGIFGRSS